MSKAQKINKWNFKDEEISRREAIVRSIRERKGAEKVDIKSTFELMYLSFIPLLGDRSLVEDDLKELRSMLDACADRMLAIREKSKGKTQR